MITPDIELLLPQALAVIDEAVAACRYARMAPLFSGGHDSYCACFIAAQHRKFDGNIYHINTGIGSTATRIFVEQVCRDEGWRLNILKSKDTFEDFVRTFGFPGPGLHGFVYNCIKDRCVDSITKRGRNHHKTLLISGCRSKESRRRMGHVEKIKYGECSKKTGKTSKTHRIWVAPCHNWSSENQIDFMNFYNLPRNPVKTSPLGMSGECFCGAFARPGELDIIRTVIPDVATEIDRLQALARECGHIPEKCVYGGPRNCGSEKEILETGPLCTSCDNKARIAGLNIIQR